MPAMREPRDLLLHELGDILYAENVLVQSLPKLAAEATDEGRAESGDRRHHGRARRVHRRGGARAGSPRHLPDGFRGTCRALRDRRLHRPDHDRARLGELECAILLEENLRQEKDALSRLERISQRLVEA